METAPTIHIVTEKTQIARRQKRALDDIKSVSNKGKHPLFSTFEVISRTERSYTVHIRSVEQLINSCTCPDYKTNTLGTCKHIEGVLLHLRNTLGRRWKKLAGKQSGSRLHFLMYSFEYFVMWREKRYYECQILYSTCID